MSSKTRQTLNKLAVTSIEAAIRELKLVQELSDKEVSLLITDDKTIKKLNHLYRAKNYATNVLSFPFISYIEGKLKEKTPATNVLGEIILSYEKVRQEAKEQGKKTEEHFIHLMVHSTLHLLGFDHEKKKQAEKMEALEVKILKQKFKIKDPYIFS